MSKDKEATNLSNGSENALSAPPGFVSRTSFRLKRIRTPDETGNSKDSSDAMTSVSNDAVSEKCLRNRPWIAFDRKNHESDSDQSEKVTARWRPNDAREDAIKDAPVYYPTEEEFEDAVTYIAKIRPSAQPYGICRIVPPSSWDPPCTIKEKKIWENYKFVTHFQRIDGIQVPYSKSEAVYVNRKRRGTLGNGLDFGCDNGHTESWGENGSFDTEHLRSPQGLTVKTFKQYADDFKSQYFSKSKVTKSNASSTVSQGKHEPSVKSIEGEYQRIVDNPTEEIEVLCCDGLNSRIFGSGFPTTSKFCHPEIVSSSWNLNNVPMLPGSLLSSESSNTSHILAPRVRIGMCFSTLHWRVEEHHLYALCYLHLGDHKIWYGVPSRDSLKLQAVMKNLSTDVIEKQHRLVKHLSPSALTSEGIPVFRCVQNPGEFVVIFPGAYRSGFDCGFNVSETVNFAPLDWLPHGQNAVEIYRALGKRTSLSHDKLLLQAASLAVRALWELSLRRKETSCNKFWKDACEREGILTKVFKFRVKCEEKAREFYCISSRTQRMDENFDRTSKRECKICLYDLHFSAAGCPCSPDVYSCLNHANQLCSSCAWTDKFFLFRHDTSDLNLLVEALEGKLGPIYKYAKEKLGLSLSSVPRSLPTPQQELHLPATPSLLDKLVQRGQNSSIRAEVKARVIQSTVLKKRKSTEPSAKLPIPSERNVASYGNKDPETHKSEPTKTSIQAQSKQKITAQVISSTVDKSHSFPQLESALGVPSNSSSECSSDESDGGIRN